MKKAYTMVAKIAVALVLFAVFVPFVPQPFPCPFSCPAPAAHSIILASLVYHFFHFGGVLAPDWSYRIWS
jgi:hypothetical protein